MYLSGLGWVDFNPTPTRPLVARAQDDSEFQTAEEAALAEEEGEAVLSLLDDFEVDPFSGSAGPILLPDEQNGILRHKESPQSSATLRDAGGRPRHCRNPRGSRGARLVGISLPATACRRGALRRSFLNLAGWAGVGPLSTRTPLEAARELSAATGLGSELTAIARAYTSRRYGRPEERPEDGFAEGLTQAAEPDPRAPDLEAAYVGARNRLLRMTGRLAGAGTPADPAAALDNSAIRG